MIPRAQGTGADAPRGAPTGLEGGRIAASILRDPGALRPEKGSDRPAEPVSEAPGSRRSSIDEGVRVPGGPVFEELTPAGRAALESELEPLSGIPGLYVRGPSDDVVRFELTPAAWAELRRIRREPGYVYGSLAAELARKSLEDNEAELELRESERRGVLSRHARAVAAELDGKEPPRDRRERRGDGELERALERPGRRDP